MSDDDGVVVLDVQLDPRWIELPLQEDVDPGDWAAQVVDEALSVRGMAESPQVRELYEQTYAALLESAGARREQDGTTLAGAFALVGGDDLLPITVVELAVSRSEGLGLDAVVDSLVAPADQRFGEPDVSELETASGTAVRLQQLRVVDQGEGQEPTVETSVVHVWPGPAEHLVTTLSAWFGSPVDAETSREPLRELAVSLRRRPA